MAGVVVGVVGGVLTFISILQGLTPPASNQATVRIAAALHDPQNGPTQSAGDVVSVRIYNELQDNIGYNNGYQWIPDGGFKDIKISQKNNQQATFAQIHAGNDATCVPYVSVTWADGSKYAWLGDWGRQCGANWYYGNIYVSESQYKPACTWIDKDQTPGSSTPEVIFIHFPSFKSKNTSNCGWKAFRAWNSQKTIARRDEDGPVDGRLTISADPQHDPVELCESETSLGPHLANTALGVYCNMETREVLPLCSEGEDEPCFDVHAARNQTLSTRALRDGSVADFTDIISWEV